MKKYYVFIFILSTTVFAYTQNTEKLLVEWDKTIGGTNIEKGLANYSFVFLVDYITMFGGTSNSSANSIKSESSINNDYWIFELYSGTGDITYNKTIRGFNSDNLVAIYNFSLPVIGGYSNSNIGYDKTENSKGGFDFWIVGLENDSTIAWDKTFGTIANDTLVDLINVKTNTSNPTSKHYIAGGYNSAGISGDKTSANKGMIDSWLVLFRTYYSLFPNGYNAEKISDYSFGGNGNDYLRTMTSTEDKGLLLGIQSNSTISGDKTTPNYGGYDNWIIKTDSFFNIEWQKSYGGSGDENINQILSLSDGNFLLIGTSTSPVSGNKTNGHFGNGDVWIIKIDKDGEIIWQRTLGSVDEDTEPTAIELYDEIEDNYKYIIATTSSSNLSGNKTVLGYGGKDIWIVKLNANGVIISQNSVGGNHNEIKPTLSKTRDINLHNYILLGCTSFSNISGLKTENNYGGGYVNNESDFWLTKLDFIPNIETGKLTGKVFNDYDKNCAFLPFFDKYIQGVIIKDSKNGFYSITDDNGMYQIDLDTGFHQLKLIIPEYLQVFLNDYACPEDKTIEVNITDINNMPINNNFAINYNECTLLNIDVTSTRRLRCFKSNTVIKYSNLGNVASNNTKIYVQMPNQVQLISANEPYTQINDSVFEFNIGVLDKGQTGQINIIDSVKCENVNTLGLTQCTKAWITPKNDCYNNLDTTINSWDHSSISVTGVCKTGFIRFSIINSGEAMQDSSEYRIYENGLLALTANFKLTANDTLIVDVYNNQLTYRLEADQTYGHPGNSHPNATVETCAAPANRMHYNDLPQDDEDYEIAEECLPITGSYDPNDKQVQPSGTGESNQLYRNTRLNYVIRFQNTGTDTAFNVIVIDTLSPLLDISTLILGASSHLYELTMKDDNGATILTFTFNNINLPDSARNELESNGMFSFSIKAFDTISNGTILENNADIYFDFNDPIKTNTTSNLMDDRFPTSNNLIILTAVNQQNNYSETVKVFPNPSESFIVFQFKQNTKAKQIIISSIEGKVILTKEVANEFSTTIPIQQIATGIYFYKVVDVDGNIISNGKIIKQ